MQQIAKKIDPKSKNLIIVGDIFSSAESHLSNIITFSNLNIDENNTSVEYIIGQGLTYKQLKSVIESVLVLKNKNLFYECKENVHKKHEENVIITIPEEVSEHVFKNNILINSDSGFIDHTTGLHIPAMLLIEAARQSMLAITERFYVVHEQDKNKLRFTLFDITSNFNQFCLPIETTIESRIKIKRKKSDQYFFASIECNIIQNSILCATILIDYLCSPEEKMLHKEIEIFNSIIN